jgi:hypothetical protein
MQIYEEGFGKMVNKDKSSVMFSSRTTRNTRSFFSLQSLEMGLEATDGRYLRLPTYIGR